MLNKIFLTFCIFFLYINTAHAETLIVYSTEGDGQIRTPDSTDWTTVVTSLVGDEIYYNIGSIVTQVRKASGDVRNINRSFLAFNTSSLPSNAVVTDVKLIGYVVGKNNGLDDIFSYIGVFQGFQSSVNELVESDVSKCGDSIIKPTIGSAKVYINSVNQFTYVEFPLNNDGINWINKNGFTKLCLREGHDAENVEYIPLGNFIYNDIGIRSADWEGVDQDPRLEITYFVPTSNLDAPVSLNQIRVDGTSTIGDNEHFTGNTVVFSGEIGVDDGGVKRALEVEVKEMSESFDEMHTHISSFSTESEVMVRVSNFFSNADLYGGNNNGDFKWRARTVDEDGNMSAWAEFGDDNTDFSLTAVPLMTQIPSGYPSLVETTDWADKPYAFGNSVCGSSSAIRGCGCALSSLSTIGRYYGIMNGVDDSEVNPDNFNEWLKANNGYDSNEHINWTSAIKYFSRKDVNQYKQFLTIGGYLKQLPAINAALSDGPVLAKSNPAGYTHFFTIDSALDNGYEISDPYWFNTEYTNEVQDYVNNVQDYDDVILAAKDIKYHSSPILAKKSLEVHLASPAEFVVTDNEGNRFGYDPRTDTTYEEIATSDYWYETDIASGPEEAPTDVHVTKYGWILDAAHSPYTIEVIGTSDGEYDLSVLLTETGGESTQLEFSSTTSDGEMHSYIINFKGDEPGEVSVEDKLLAFLDWKRSKLEYMPRFLARIVAKKLDRLEEKLNAREIRLTKGQTRLLNKWYEGYQKNPDNYWPFLGLVYSLYNKYK